MQIAVREICTTAKSSSPAGGWWGFWVEARQANASVGIVKSGSPSAISLEYSIDGGISWDAFVVGSTTITLPSEGDKVCFRAGSAGNSALASNTSAYHRFNFSNWVAIGGNILSLLTQTETTEFPSQTGAYTFLGLFSNANALKDASALEIPITTCLPYCFRAAFSYCIALANAPKLPAVTLASNCYQLMFNGCSALTEVPELPAKVAAASCYSYMFSGCTSLRQVPRILPATVLANSCYQYMFSNCTALTVAPKLPAEVLMPYCYQSMFSGCSWLRSITTHQVSFTGCDYWVSSVAGSGVFKCPSALGDNNTITRGYSACPTGWTVTNLWWGFYVEAKAAGATVSMTRGTGAPVIALEYSIDEGDTWNTFTIGGPALVMSNIGDKVCFRAALAGNAALAVEDSANTFHFTSEVVVGGNIMSLLSQTEITEFPATATSRVFQSLFDSATTLSDASELRLPASTMTDYCYSQMFKGCSALLQAPETSAVTLAEGCYLGMFQGCVRLSEASPLPATTLASHCYDNMFCNCQALSSPPDLMASSISPGCYYEMFKNCSALTQAPDLPATTLANACYSSMFAGCSSLEAAPSLPAEILVTDCYKSMFAGCSALQYVSTAQTSFLGCDNWLAGVASSGRFVCPSTLGDSSTIERGVSACPVNWTVKTLYEGFYVKALQASATVKMAKSGTPPSASLEYSTDEGETWTTFDMSGSTVVTLENQGDKVCFRSGSTGNDRLGSGTSAYHKFVFTKDVEVGGNLASLLSQNNSAELPASAGSYAFASLFNGATTLKKASALHFPSAIPSAATYCFVSMFAGCSTMAYGPTLPATTIADYCYRLMFSNCSVLETAPELPAETLKTGCYSYMFNGCKKLTAAPALPALSATIYCYQYMFLACTGLTAAPELPATTLNKGCYSNMFNGCTSIVEAPNLAAATMATDCYNTMFSGCTHLASIKTAQTSFTGCTNWVNNVAASGTFTCPAALGDDSTITRGTSACPTGWTVVNV